MILHYLTTTAADIVSAFPGQVPPPPAPVVPNPPPAAPPGSEKFVQIMGWAKWVALAVAVLGLIAAGAMMTISSRRGEGSEHAGRIGGVLAGVIVIGAAGAIVGFIAT